MTIHTGLMVYQSGEKYFVGVSDEDALRHCKAKDFEDKPERLSDDLYLSDKVLEALKEGINEPDFSDPIEEDGGLLCDYGLYEILEGRENDVVSRYASAENPAKALELCMNTRPTMFAGILGGSDLFSKYPGYIVTQKDVDTSYSKEALLKISEDLDELSSSLE